MIIRSSLITLLACIIVALPVLAVENLDAWSHVAPVYLEGNNKYKSLFLTEEVYEHAASGLVDLRIVDNQGSFVPFYIQNGAAIVRQNQIIYQATVQQTFKKYNDSYIDFLITSIKDNTDVSGNSLIFELPAGNFLKHVEIYGSYDGDSWEFIGKDYVFRAEGREKNEVYLGGLKKYIYYRIIILDNPENIALRTMRLSNSYTDNQWSSFLKTSPVDFDVKTDRNSSIITLQNRQKLAIRQISLEVEDNFQRMYKVYGDTQDSTLLKSGELYNLQFENTKIANTKIDLSKNPVSAPVIVIRIDNRDDRPLTIKAVKIEYYIDKLVFPDMGNTPYRLYFGNDKAVKPNYELELQKAYIEKEQQDISTLGDVQGKPEEVTVSSALNTKYIFNGIIVAVSLLLIIVLLPRINARK